MAKKEIHPLEQKLGVELAPLIKTPRVVKDKAVLLFAFKHDKFIGDNKLNNGNMKRELKRLRGLQWRALNIFF